jgi:hypothetical protein
MLLSWEEREMKEIEKKKIRETQTMRGTYERHIRGFHKTRDRGGH